jgi:S-formylglutathione hydrolase
MTGELNIDDYITHTIDSLEEVNKSIDALHSGNCLRAVVKISESPQVAPSSVKVLSSNKHFGGVLKTVQHWSASNNCNMKFTIYLPEESIKGQRGEKFPVLYFLAGLTCTHENGP